MRAGALKLFISYRRDDSEHAAQRVRMCLEAKFGADAVLMDREIPPGEDWAVELETMLAECTGVIVLVGDAFLRALRKGLERPPDNPDWLAREIEIAIRLKKKIYPVLIGALDMPQASDLPASIRDFAGKQAVFAREPAFDAAMAVLGKSIADEFGWTEPAKRPGDAAAPAPGPVLRGAGLALLALLATAAVWFTGRLILWLGDAGAAPPRQAESAFWYGAHYVLATTLWGLGPYLAYRAVYELRARARLPIHNLHAVLSVCNLVVVLLVGGTFLLMSTRPGWALRLLGVLPDDPSRLQYALQGLVLAAIVFAALAVALLEPRVRQWQGAPRAWGMHAINAGDGVVMLCGFWFAASLANSLPPLTEGNTVPMVGYPMLCLALSMLVAVWDYAQSQLGVSGRAWQIRALFGLAIGLYLVCTLAYFADGPSGLLARGA